MEPINASTSNSFGASLSRTSSISLVAGKSAKSVVGKPKWVRVWRSLRRKEKSKFWCLSLSLSPFFMSCIGRSKSSKFLCCRKLPIPGSCCLVEVAGKGSKFWEIDLVWREGLYLGLGWRVSKNTIEKKNFLTEFSPRGGFFPGIVPTSGVYCFMCCCFGNFLMN